jgi:MarR family transcriptional regulator for hemolysin
MAEDKSFLDGVLHRGGVAGHALPTLAEIGLNSFVPYLLNRIAARWNAELAGELREFDLTTPQMRTLAVLSLAPDLTINELSALTVTEQSTMSRTLDALEERRLVRRRPRPGDMRVREVAITPEGRAAFEAFWPVMFQHYRRMFRDVDEAEYAQLVAILHKVLRNVRPGGEAPSQ